MILQEGIEGGLQRALATKQHRERAFQDARHVERQHKVHASLPMHNDAAAWVADFSDWHHWQASFVPHSLYCL